MVTIVNPNLNGTAGTFSTTSSVSVNVTTSVVGRYLFYHDSAFDTSDDNAIATDKTALLPGQTATFANYSSYSNGINGIMIDITGPVGALSPSDFTFAVGNNNNPSTWTAAPLPLQATIRPGAGVGGSTRVELIWADGAITNTWLQVTVKGGPGSDSGLAANDVFYFGNAIGESGDSATDMKVNATDEVAARLGATSLAPITDDDDYNRDGRVDSADENIARANYTYFLNEVHLITVPITASGFSASLPVTVPLVLLAPTHPMGITGTISPTLPITLPITLPVTLNGGPHLTSITSPIKLPELPTQPIVWSPTFIPGGGFAGAPAAPLGNDQTSFNLLGIISVSSQTIHATLIKLPIAHK